jgi:hypothetical protein
VSDLLFYGLDEAGGMALTEQLSRRDAAALKALARERLDQFHAVEIWDGPLCVVRLRRAPENA